MKSIFTYGKLAAISAALALLTAITLMYSLYEPTDPTGPITKLIGSFLFSPPNQPIESTIQPVGTFDISEKNIQTLLTILVIGFSIISGGLAMMASRKEQSSLWYSLAIICSPTR